MGGEREREIDMSVEAGKSEICLQGKLTGWRPEEAWMLQLDSLEAETLFPKGLQPFSLKVLNRLDEAHPHYRG